MSIHNDQTNNSLSTGSTTIVINTQTPIPKSFHPQALIKQVLKMLSINEGHFEFTFVDKATIKAINIDYLERDEFTDVISFNLGSTDNIEGDVYICVDVAHEQAKAYEQSIEDELNLLVIHGLLHLMGYEDEDPDKKAIMFKKQDEIFQKIKKNQQKISRAFDRSSRTRLDSFADAARGVGYGVYSQRNLRFHLFAGTIVSLVGVYVNLSATEWCVLLLTMLFVIVTEMLNTAIEIVVDLVTKKRKMRAMLAKDVAAGAVMLACINAIIVGGIIFIPKIWKLIS